MDSEDGLREAIRSLERQVTILETKMQGIWWVMNAIGLLLIAYAVKEVFGKV